MNDEIKDRTIEHAARIGMLYANLSAESQSRRGTLTRDQKQTIAERLSGIVVKQALTLATLPRVTIDADAFVEASRAIVEGVVTDVAGPPSLN